jgi:hypothetical protein
MLSPVVSEWSSEVITHVDPQAQAPEDPIPRNILTKRRRRPDDDQAEKISLRIGRGGAEFFGPEAWTLADTFLAHQGGTVQFSISFGDGFIFAGLADKTLSLADHVRKPETFRTCHCPELSLDQTKPLHAFFLASYQIGIKPTDGSAEEQEHG